MPVRLRFNTRDIVTEYPADPSLAGRRVVELYGGLDCVVLSHPSSAGPSGFSQINTVSFRDSWYWYRTAFWGVYRDPAGTLGYPCFVNSNYFFLWQVGATSSLRVYSPHPPIAQVHYVGYTMAWHSTGAVAGVLPVISIYNQQITIVVPNAAIWKYSIVRADDGTKHLQAVQQSNFLQSRGITKVHGGAIVFNTGSRDRDMLLDVTDANNVRKIVWYSPRYGTFTTQAVGPTDGLPAFGYRTRVIQLWDPTLNSGGILYLTGLSGFLRIYYYLDSASEWTLLKYSAPDGSLSERFPFPDGDVHWDMRTGQINPKDLATTPFWIVTTNVNSGKVRWLRLVVNPGSGTFSVAVTKTRNAVAQCVAWGESINYEDGPVRHVEIAPDGTLRLVTDFWKYLLLAIRRFGQP